MALLPTLNPNPFSPLLSTTNPNPNTHHLTFSSSSYTKHLLPLRATTPNSTPNPKPPKRRSKPKPPHPPPTTNIDKTFPETIPPKPRRGRKSEATAVEDFIRKSLSQTFESIRKQNSDVSAEMENVLKDNQDICNNDNDKEDDDMDDTENDYLNNKKVVVEEEDPNWPLDADIGWGIRASEYFDQHPIKNIAGNDGVEIDWEGEMDDNYVKEINCLEWESIAYHPSPLIVLVFERYNNAGENWKVLKELEKAIKVYWSAKDRLPPRTVKIDINIERDLAYALKVKECPQLLFLKGNRIMYRERGNPTADELVQMIAHFYYNAKKPSCIDDAALAPPY